jgi:hypothetical protein
MVAAILSSPAEPCDRDAGETILARAHDVRTYGQHQVVFVRTPSTATALFSRSFAARVRLGARPLAQTVPALLDFRSVSTSLWFGPSPANVA